MQVLVNKPIHPDAIALLESRVTLLTPYAETNDRVLEMLTEADGVVLSGSLVIGRHEMSSLPRLKVIGRHGVGLDTVDVEAATERNLPVVYTPYGPTESTAEHALLLLLAAARQLVRLDRAQRGGNFAIRSDFDAIGRELRGKALGVVGFGRIGRRLAEMCRAAFDMTVYVFDPFLDPEQVIEWGATPVQDIHDLARRVDFLSIHTPSTPDTHHLIDGKVFEALKPEAIVVNASRGPVVDEAALVAALQQGRIAGAGIDVYDPEPPAPDNPLFALDRVVVTPHIASFTVEGRRLMGMTVAKDVLAVLDGELPEYPANPQIWPGR